VAQTRAQPTHGVAGRPHHLGRSNSRMSPDLPRGTGKSIGGDLKVDDEGSE
jgi:hypothetical protein